MHVSATPEGNGLEWACAAGAELAAPEQALTRKAVTSTAISARRHMLLKTMTGADRVRMDTCGPLCTEQLYPSSQCEETVTARLLELVLGLHPD